MPKIKKLSFVFVGLLLISLMLVWVGKKGKVTTVDKTLFAVVDTTQMSGIVIQSDDQLISIKRSENYWRINDKHNADPQLIYLAQRILNAVQTQRPISPSGFETIRKELEVSGKKITIELSTGEVRSFYAGGNTAKTTAYFGNEDLSKIYTVAIPGYKSYLSGIFELTLNQWRDRVLFASSWRTIQELEIDYVDENQEDLNINFDQQFLAVEGVNALDTAALMAYLQPLEHFQLNDYLNAGSFPKYDSLIQVQPLASLTIKDIDIEKHRNLTIYPKIAGERFYLLTNKVNEMMVIDVERMEALMAEPADFIRK